MANEAIKLSSLTKKLLNYFALITLLTSRIAGEEKNYHKCVASVDFLSTFSQYSINTDSLAHAWKQKQKKNCTSVFLILLFILLLARGQGVQIFLVKIWLHCFEASSGNSFPFLCNRSFPQILLPSAPSLLRKLLTS